MVGGRKEEGGFTINNSNVFAALDTSRKKKSKDKRSGSSKNSSKLSSKTEEKEPVVFWQPTPLKVTSWADVEEEDDDDYYATSAPLSSTWGVSGSVPAKEIAAASVEESESEDDMLDLGDEEVDEDHEHETEAPVHPEPVVKTAPEIPAPPKETERQLSKKERKKKELEELDALLADMGVTNGNGEGAAQEKKIEDQMKPGQSDNGEQKEGMPVESKSAKKKKKKDKTLKEAKEAQDQPDSPKVTAESTEPVEEDAASLDMKERFKKLAAAKKKKSSKEMDGAAKAAALEVAARNARLAAAKKKEKSHYNQQPVR